MSLRPPQFGRWQIAGFLCFFEHPTDFLKFLFGGTQNRPDFARILLDGKRPEADLQAVEDGSQRSGAGDYHFVVPLKLFQQERNGADFRINAFEGQEHDAKIGCRG